MIQVQNANKAVAEEARRKAEAIKSANSNSENVKARRNTIKEDSK